MRNINGTINQGEVITLNAEGHSFEVVTAAPYASNLDPGNPRIAPKAINCTFVFLPDQEVLDNNDPGRGAVVRVLSAGIDSIIVPQVHNEVFHAPNLPSSSGGANADAPLDGSANWTPQYSGRRFFGDVDCVFSSGDGLMLYEANVTGQTSGATGKIKQVQKVNSGSFIDATASGTVLIGDSLGEFQSGETVSDGVNSFVIDSQSSYLDGVIARFATPATATAFWTPQSGSAAINDADTEVPFAIDDFFGTLRGNNPSRGATEA